MGGDGARRAIDDGQKYGKGSIVFFNLFHLVGTNLIFLNEGSTLIVGVGPVYICGPDSIELFSD
jgi:hypothetical protein